MEPISKLRKTFVALAACTVAVFAAFLLGLTSLLRTRLNGELLQREADVVYAVTLMQVTSAEARLTGLGASFGDEDIFTAVLESSRLSGVLSVQLFDTSGKLRAALPDTGADTSNTVWWPLPLTTAVAQFHPSGSLEQALGIPREAGAATVSTPLLEIIVPLGRTRGDGSLGSARIWIEGAGTGTRLRRNDTRLFTQAGAALLAGGALVIVLLGWAYRRLVAAQRRLLEQAADLQRANEELDFAAKTGALGAISAHLIHGLKNPLAGLEGFVAEASAIEDPAMVDARRTAFETARRLRALVNEVITVLRDESGEAAYPVPLNEVVDAVQARATPAAAAAGVGLDFKLEHPEAELSARTANLAGLVLANLLANGVHASPPDTCIRLVASREGSNIHFVVADQGPGLPEAVRASLFRPLKSSKPGGSGLGLAISHRLARHAGGDLSLLRTDSTGTSFLLVVPAYVASTNRTALA